MLDQGNRGLQNKAVRYFSLLDVFWRLSVVGAPAGELAGVTIRRAGELG